MLREVKIKPVLNGWIVEVGCQTLVFIDGIFMAEELLKYLDDPDEVEKRYLEESVNSGKLDPAWTHLPLVSSHSDIRVDGDEDTGNTWSAGLTQAP